MIQWVRYHGEIGNPGSERVPESHRSSPSNRLSTSARRLLVTESVDLPKRQNVFLDFLNRDSRQIYGLYRNLSREQHVRSLTTALNVAAFLCSDFLIAPPGFLVECPIAREALSRREAMLTEGLIRLPLREDTLDELFDKKLHEYGPYKRDYKGLFDERSRRFLYNHSTWLIPRRTKIGDAMVQSWEQGPDSDPSWNIVKRVMPGGDLERIRSLPRWLSEQGLAVTWPAIKSAMAGIKADPRSVRLMVQHHYFALYIAEYDLRIITGLPFTRSRFGLE